jgi:hypothetical protein
MALRTTVMTISALVTAVVVGVASIFTSALSFVAVASTTVLIMGGTGNSLATPPDTLEYVQLFTSAAINNFVSPSSTAGTGIPGGPYNAVAVITPEEAAPGYGSLTLLQSVAQGLASLDSCIASTTCNYNADIGSTAPATSDTFVVFGYSQSAAIAMLEKAKLAAEYAEGEGPDVTFVVTGNTRPNGGWAARDVDGVFTPLIFGFPRSQMVTDPAPTDTQYATVDIALQYDLLADAPLNPLNLLAMANAYMGVLLLHPNYSDYSLSDSGTVDQGQYGDTHYYLIPAPILPLLMPLQKIPFVGSILADTLDPALRVLVEAGYDRTISPGQPTPFNLLYFPNPVKTALNFLLAIPTGLDNGFQDAFGVRPFRTVRPGPDGVGGPSVVDTTSEPADTLVNTSSASSKSAAQSTPTSDGGTSSVSSEKTKLAHVKRSATSAAASSSKNSAAGSDSSSSRKSSTSSTHRHVGSAKG